MTSSKTNNDQDIKELEEKMEALAEKVGETNKQIDGNSRKTDEELTKLEEGIDQTAAEVEEIFADLESAEKEAGDELDALVLDQAENTAEEE